MNNSEVPEPSSEDSTDQKNQTSKKDGASNKRRAKQARKGDKSETNTSAALVDDPAYAEECSKVLRKMELQHFVVSCDKLEDPSQCEGAPFFCELCEAKLQSVLDCQNHVVTRAHKKAKKSKGEYLVLSRVKSPSNPQISALNKLLDAIFHEHGLCPEKDLRVRQEVANDVSKTVKVMHPECSVSIYGSSLTGFGLKESDVNLDLVIPDESPHVQVSIAEVSTPNKNSYNTCWQVSVPPVLLSILDLLGKDGNYSEVKSEFDAKVPQILFKHVSSGLECELSPGNFSATKTSCLLKKYKDLDSRVQVLAVCLRRWARICSVDCQSEGGLPGYSFALMVIQFLQVIEPPVLPRLAPTEVVDCDSPNLSQDFVTSNKDEIGSLWFQLFRFYCIEFDIPTQVISIQEPVPLMRQDKKWGQKRIAIEDPFATKRNVASSLGSDKAWEYFFGCWKNSFCYWGSLPSNSQKKPRPEVAKVDKNARTEKKTNDEPLKDTNRKAELANTEEEIVEMEYSDLVTKQTVSMEIYDVDGEQKEVSSRVKGEKNLAKLQSTGPSDTEEDIVITLSETESEKSSEVGLKRDVKAAAESKDVAREPLKTKISSAEEIEYKFDPQVFRGNSHPVKTCCFCKKDGHIKENCPDLRKPSLLKLPPMTPEFAAMVDITCRTCRADFEFGKAEEADREQVVKNLEEYIHELYPDAKLHLFGSSKNGFGFQKSDMDICMTLGNRTKEEVDAVEVITELAKLLKKHKDCKTVVPITTAKVPIVKFYLRSCQREADISLYNVLALENTAMLATYAKLDDRVATLGYTVKVFAKVCDIGDASKGSLSSYAYILMMLHYLQQCRPPVIPVLQSLYEEEKQPEKIIDNWNCWFCSDFNKINCLWKPKERNRMSAGYLWLGFLRYYTEVFDFEHDVVCCRRTKKLTKFEKMWTKNEFAIEDPFNLDHNLGAGLTRKMAMYIMCAFIKGRERFGLPCFIPPQFLQRYFFDVYFLTDGYEAPNDRNCRVCGKIGHFAKDCPLSKSNKRAEQKIEEEERKALQAGAIEESALSTKPFGGGPSWPRSASTANKQRPDSSGVDTTPQPTTEPSNIPPHRSAAATNLSSTEAEPQIGTSPITGGQTAGDRDGNSVNAIGIPPLMHGKTIQGKSVEATAEASQQGQANIDPDRSGNSMNAIGIPPLMQVNTIRLMHGKTVQGKSIEATAEASQQEQANIDSNENRTPDALLTVSSPVTTDEHLTSLASPNGSPVRTQMASSLPNTPQNVSPPPGFHMPDGSTQMPYSSNTPRTLASPTPLANRATVGSFDGKPISLQTPPQHHAGILNSPGGHYMGSAAQLWYPQQQALMMLAHYSPLARQLVPYPPSPDPQTFACIQMARGHTQSCPIGTLSPPIHGQQQALEHSLEAIAKSPPIISRNVMWPAGIPSPPQGGREAQFYSPQPLPLGCSSGLPVPAMGSPRQVIHHATQGRFIGTPGANIESPNHSTHGSPQVTGSPHPMPQQLQFPHSPQTPPGLVSPPRPMPQTQAQFIESLWQNQVHMTGEQFINSMKAVEEESNTFESTPESIEECETEELEHLPPEDSKLAETPEEHQLLSKLNGVRSLWDGSLPPESEDSVVSTEAEPLTPQHQTTEPDDELPVKTEAWVGPEKDSDSSQSKGVCSDEKADTGSRNPNCLSASNRDGYEMSSATAEQKEEASPVAKRLDVDDKVQVEASGKVETQGSSAIESRAATTDALEEPASPRRGRRRRRGKKAKNVRNTNAPERPGENGSEDPSRKKDLDEQGGKQANFSDSKAFKRESAAEKPEEKSPNGSSRKEKNEKRRHPKTYDDFKDSPNNYAAQKPDKASPATRSKKGTGQQREAQEKFDNTKGFGQVCVQEKQTGKSPGGNQRKGKHPQDSHQRSDDLKAEPLKESRAAKEQGESGKGKPRSAERGSVSFPERSETPPRSNPGGKKGPAGVGRGAGSKGSDTSPRASNKGGRGGTPNRGGRAHRSSNKSSTVGDTRQLRHSTP